MASSEGFLTDEKREMLATENVEVFSTSLKSPSGLHSPNRLMAIRRIKAPADYKAMTEIFARHVHRTYLGNYVRVKKDGSGRGTLDKVLDTGAESRIVRNDPKYGSSEEPYLLFGSIVNDPVVAERIEHYKKEGVAIICEYFLSDDIPEVMQSLKDLGKPEFNPIFLKKLLSIAMDRKNKEREMASVLLSSLHIELFSTEDFVNGFVMLLEAAEDTALDVLDASVALSFFLARAVVDEVLAPFNLEEIECRLPSNCCGSEALALARSHLAALQAGMRILRCWGGGTGWVIEDAKDKIVKLLEEYETGGVLSEACQCIRDLDMPFFNHEVVKQALVKAMENKNDKMLDLLHECFCEGLISTNQLTIGFTRISDTLDDLALDIPGAEERFNLYVEYAQQKGWLLPSYGLPGTYDPRLLSAAS